MNEKTINLVASMFAIVIVLVLYGVSVGVVLSLAYWIFSLITGVHL